MVSDLQRKVQAMETKKNASAPASLRLNKRAETAAVGGDIVKTITRSIMLKVGRMVDAKFEGFADRLLPETRIRPSLAADKKLSSAANVTNEGQKRQQQPSTQRTAAGKNSGANASLPAASAATNTEAWNSGGGREGANDRCTEGQGCR